MTKGFESMHRRDVAPDEGRAVGPSTGATAHVIELPELGGPRGDDVIEGVAGTGAPIATLGAESPLRYVKARLTVCVGTAEITVGELLGATEQHVLRLDRAVDQPVEVLLEGHVVARGILVAVDDRFAVRITELPVRLDAQLQANR